MLVELDPLNNKALIIENTGHPIEGETNQLFERFKKGREESNTTGLAFKGPLRNGSCRNLFLRWYSRSHAQ
jgi:hypothetical protein